MTRTPGLPIRGLATRAFSSSSALCVFAARKAEQAVLEGDHLAVEPAHPEPVLWGAQATPSPVDFSTPTCLAALEPKTLAAEWEQANKMEAKVR